VALVLELSGLVLACGTLELHGSTYEGEEAELMVP
jgi:hypothetical protein